MAARPTRLQRRLIPNEPKRSLSASSNVMGEKCLQRYFFIFRSSDGREHGDDEGTVLANDGAAQEYAVRIISELIDGGGYDDPGLSVIVKDAAERQILAIPFSQFR
jgi:hypothetical protein